MVIQAFINFNGEINIAMLVLKAVIKELHAGKPWSYFIPPSNDCDTVLFLF